MPNNPVYECVQLDTLGKCDSWQVAEQNEVTPPLDQSEQSALLYAILSVMVTVWLFKMLKRAI
jgi:hypothetical protein